MPYIAHERREALQPSFRAFADNAGELQFQIACLIEDYIRGRGEIRYQFLNDVLGALSGASAEFYRRIVAPYEDQAITRNGDVYDLIIPLLRRRPPGVPAPLGSRP